jgi:hypothetical protein
MTVRLRWAWSPMLFVREAALLGVRLDPAKKVHVAEPKLIVAAAGQIPVRAPVGYSVDRWTIAVLADSIDHAIVVVPDGLDGYIELGLQRLLPNPERPKSPMRERCPALGPCVLGYNLHPLPCPLCLGARVHAPHLTREN